MQGFGGVGGGGLGERDHLEDLGLDGDNIKTDLQKVGWGVLDWIDLAECRDR